MDCQLIEQQVTSETRDLDMSELIRYARDIGVAESEMGSRSEIITACVAVEQHCFVH